MATCFGYHHVLHLLPGLNFGCRLYAQTFDNHNHEITRGYRRGFHGVHTLLLS